MTPLGHGHFDAPLEPLPGETVLWEGGAAPAGLWIRIARVLSVPLAFLLLYALVVGSFFLLMPTGGDEIPATPPAARAVAKDADQANPTTKAKATTQAKFATQGAPAAKAPVRRTRLYPPKQVAAALTWFTLIGVIGIGYARLRMRNAWYVVTSERVCVQSGALTRSLCVIDLDKILSVEVSSSFLERRFGLQSIQFVHAGGKNPNPYNLQWALGDAYSMVFVRTDGNLASRLLNQWLPRDDHRRN
jgi:hypothetical protein